MLTPAQQQALKMGYHISVTAGAGSGKTTILVAKYLGYLERWFRPGLQDILALTFTNKAAQEMKSRIRKKIQEKIQGLPSEEREIWKRIREEIGSAYISTIHGFCARLLQENPLLSNLDPDFGILQGPDETLLLERSMAFTFQQLESFQDPDYLELLKSYNKREIWSFIEHILSDEADYPFDLECHLPWDHRRLQEALREMILANLGLQRACATLEIFLEKDFYSSPFFNLLQDFLESFSLLHRGEISIDQFSLPLGEIFFNDKGKLKSSFKKSFKNLEAPEKEELNQILKTIVGEIKKVAPFMDLQKIQAIENLSCEMLNHFHRLLQKAHHHYQARKRKDRVLDFRDLQWEALKLLQKYPGLRTFGALLIDEFQDTNHLQWDVIRLLGREESDFFLVGDEKQSIYGFRGAKVEVFSRVRSELTRINQQKKEPSLSGTIGFQDNFRSLYSIIGAVNHLFEKLLSTEEKRDPTEPDFMALHCSRQIPSAHWGSVEVLLEGREEEDCPKAEEQRDMEADMIARRILEGVQENHPRSLYVVRDGSYPPSEPPSSWELRYLKGIHRDHLPDHLRLAQLKDMAILIQSRTILPQIEEALRRYKIPYYVPGGIGFYQRQEIKDLVALLSFFVDSRDDYALWGVLKSPLFGFSEELVFLLSTFPGSHLYQKFTGLYQILSRLDLKGLGSLGIKKQREALQKALPDCSKEKLENLTLLLQPMEKKYHLSGALSILNAHEVLKKWSLLSRRLPIARALRDIIHQSGYLASMSAFANGPQKIANVEKLVQLARSWDRSQKEGLGAFVQRLIWLISHEQREGEAQMESGENAVRIFTIHMSKGLEFPIVFLAQFSKEFQPIREDFLYEREVGPGFKPVDRHDLYQRQTPLSWASLQRQKTNKMLAEEKRLLYVGATRAKDHLILSGYWNKKAEKSDQCWLNWLKDHLQFTSTNLSLASFSSSGSETTLIFQKEAPENFADKDIWIPILTSKDLREAEEKSLEKPTFYQKDFYSLLKQGEPSLQKSFAFDVKKDQTTHLSPSDLSALSKCPRKYYYERVLKYQESLVKKNTKSKGPLRMGLSPQNFGDVYHKALELFVKGLEPQKIPNQVQEEYPYLSLDLPDIFQMVNRFGASSLGKKILYSGTIYAEEPFLAKIGPTILRGTMDLLWVHQDQYWIIDYKTTRFNGTTEEKLLREYELPMGIYSWAVWKRFNIDPEQISTLLSLTENFEDPLRYPQWTCQIFEELEKRITHISQTFGSLLNMKTPPASYFKPHQSTCPHCPLPSVCGAENL